MKLLVVRYGRQLGSDDPEQARGFLEVAEKIAGLPGLVWKLWAYDDAEHVAESVYLFDSDEHARAWGDGPMKPALGWGERGACHGAQLLVDVVVADRDLADPRMAALGQARRRRGGGGRDERAARSAAPRHRAGARPG
jgi:hypothetical protein